MDSSILKARIDDLLNYVVLNDKPKYFGFLSAEETAFAQKYLADKNVKFSFFGGDDSCERTILGCFPDWLENPVFPITALTVTYRTVDILHHRDFLGALMGLGIKRETIGDILIEQGRAVIFLINEVANYVCVNLKKVGNTGVTVNNGLIEALPQNDQMTLVRTTVSSLRIDCVISALCNCSRNTAVTMIENKLVAVNSFITEKITKTIENDDVISVRHKGKFKIISVDKRTKKDRFVLEYKKY